MANRTLGPYKLLEEVGYGGMATVYRANQPSVDRDVAIKVILKRQLSDPEAIQRFQREARLIARLEHPHILPVYDFDGRHDPPYIVMRYLDRGTLGDVMSQNVLPQSESFYLIQQIASALDYAHRQGVVHRDIKPSNIMMDREGNCFVTDFGIARMVSGGQEITMTGALIGTPNYMSPEQSQGQSDLDHRTDLYALGIILFQMLTGKLPYSDPNTFSVLMMHVNNPIPSALLLNQALPPAVDEFFFRALAKRPDERFQSGAELVAALGSLMGGTMNLVPDRLRTLVEQTAVLKKQSRPSTGSSIGSRPPSEQNKTITALYVTVAEYAEIVDELEGSEAARNALVDFWTAVEPLINGRGGTIASKSEDTILILWGAEISHEDDTERAVRAALEIRNTLEKQFQEFLEEEEGDDEPLPINIGLNTGLALLTPHGDTGDFSASGATISLTYRLMQQAEGQILITHNSYSQVRGVFEIEPHAPLAMRRSRNTIPTYLIKGVKPRAFRRNTRGIEGVETNLIGRESEIKTMQNAYLDAVEDEETQTITLVSDAGLGKSRLLYEFMNWVDLEGVAIRLFQGRATHEMSNRPYALIRDIISNRFEILDSDSAFIAGTKLESGLAELIGPNEEMAHFIAHLSGFDFSQSPYLKGLLDDPQQLTERAKLMFQRLILAICEDRPVLFELEDIHHADDATLDLLTDLMTNNQEVPLMFACLTRPSLLERRPTWGSGQPFHTRLELRPLDRRESRRLAREILKKVDRVPKSLRDLLVERSEGNPFFMEELIKMLIEDRVIIKQSDENWIVEEERVSEHSVPSTLVGLLQARLDSLLYPEKLTLQRAAVIGRIFYDTALQTIDAQDDVQLADLPAILNRLVEQEFVYERETTAFAGSVEYIFGKSMLQDVLLSTLLRRQQESYNEGAAKWLLNNSGNRTPEYYGAIAGYYEKAGNFEQAAYYLQAAGEQAMSVSAFSNARSLFERALTLLPAESPTRANLFLRLGSARYQLSDYYSASKSLRSALKLARSLGEDSVVADVLYWQSQTAVAEGKYDEAQTCLEESAALARESEDRHSLARVLYGLGDLQWRQGKTDDALAHLNECLAISREEGFVSQELLSMNRLGALAIGRGDLDEATMIYEEIVSKARAVGNREREVPALNNLGVVTYAQQNWEKTIYYHSQALSVAREMNQKQTVAMLANNLGDTSQRLGELEKAKVYLAEGLKVAQEIGAMPLLLMGLQPAGTLITLEGDKERGLQLLGLSITHPASNADHLRTVDDCFEFLDLDRESEAVQNGLANGRDLDLDAVIAALLAEWGDHEML